MVESNYIYSTLRSEYLCWPKDNIWRSHLELYKMCFLVDHFGCSSGAGPHLKHCTSSMTGLTSTFCPLATKTTFICCPSPSIKITCHQTANLVETHLPNCSQVPVLPQRSPGCRYLLKDISANTSSSPSGHRHPLTTPVSPGSVPAKSDKKPE